MKNKEELNNLLDNVYELEGLIHLALSRDDNAEHLSGLIARKAQSIAGMTEKSDMSDPSDKSDHTETVEVPQTVSEPRGRLVFSINDRYRFRRELFNNNDTAFNDALALVAQMDNYEEAEDYFLGELQWNPDSEEVTAFFDVLQKYYN